MGRKKLMSGATKIANAEQLFEASVRNGKADFRYVVLAIGSSPTKPPSWAIWQCLEERRREETRAAAGLTDIDRILDETVLVFFRQQQTSGDALHKRGLSLRAAIIRACSLLGERTSPSDGKQGDDSWFRDVREAWLHEQANDPSQSAFQLDGWNMTARIDRVIMRACSVEYDGIADPAKAAWIIEEVSRLND